MSFELYIVTGEANFSMDRTSFNCWWLQSACGGLILFENPEKGSSQRFLWLFPKPVYGKFNTLEPSNQEFIDKIGKYTSIYAYICTHAYFITIYILYTIKCTDSLYAILVPFIT